MSRVHDALRRGRRAAQAPATSKRPSVHADSVLATLGYHRARRTTAGPRAARLLLVAALLASGAYLAWTRMRAPAPNASRVAATPPNQPLPSRQVLPRVVVPPTEAFSAKRELPPAPGPYGGGAESRPPLAPIAPTVRAGSEDPAYARKDPAYARKDPADAGKNPAHAKPSSAGPEDPAHMRADAAHTSADPAHTRAAHTSPDPAYTRADPAYASNDPAPASKRPAYPDAAPLRDDFALALYYQRAGEFDQALLHYRAVLQRNELNVEAHNNLGLLYKDKGLLDDAAREFERALYIDARYLRARNNLGVTRREQGRLDAAAAEFRAVLAADARNVDAMVNLALVQKDSGQGSDARGTLVSALVIDPRNAPAHYNLAVQYEQLGEAGRAVEHYRAFLQYAGPEYASRAADVRQRLDALANRIQ